MTVSLLMKGRIDELTSAFEALRAKPTIRCAFVPSAETNFIKYFPDRVVDALASDFAQATAHERRIEFSADDGADIVITTAHGSDTTDELLKLRAVNPKALVAVWFWDNHLGWTENRKVAAAADLIFYSHAYAASYLANPASPLVYHVPSCSAQWTDQDVRGTLSRELHKSRNDKLLVNYVDYEFSWRSPLLRKLRAEAPEAQVLLMPPNERSRYFAKNPVERFQEWAGYKACLLLPIDQDLSTRFFDALLAGLVVVAPARLPDLDRVIPVDMQRRLGIMRLPNLDVATIRKFATMAARLFDQSGRAGILARHDFVKNNHMLKHRLSLILKIIEQMIDGKARLTFSAGGQLPAGLYAGPAEAIETR